MNLLSKVHEFLTLAPADEAVSHDLADSFTGIESYWTK